MLHEIKEIAKQLNSPADVAIVGGAGLLGFVADAAINLVPLPIFSPGVCGLAAAGAALIAKRGWEARRQAQINAAQASAEDAERKATLALVIVEARRLAAVARRGLRRDHADRIEFEIGLATTLNDPTELLKLIRDF